MKAAFILGAVFFLVFAKNWLDKRNVSELGNSFASVYEDRLVAESYIYRLSDHLYQKKIMLDNCSSLENNSSLLTNIGQHNAAINIIIRDYEKTKLTELETSCFQDFKMNVAAIEALEKDYLLTGGNNEAATKAKMDDRYKIVAGNLHQLSGIQISEGKMLSEKSKKIIAGSSLLTQFELVVLVGIGLIIQGLIFASRSALPKKPQKFSLN